MISVRDIHPMFFSIYILLLLCISISSMHPVLVVSICIGGIAIQSIWRSPKENVKLVTGELLLVLLVMATNIIFSHRGIHVWTQIGGQNVTLESAYFGCMTGIMLVGVLSWCNGLQKIYSMEKILYLFGNISPKLSLLLCIALGWMPRLKHRMKELETVAKMHGSITLLVRVRVFDQVFGWALEQSVKQADAMHARYYGQGKRTHCIRYKVHSWDWIYLAVTISLTALFCIGSAKGFYSYYYFPQWKTVAIDQSSIVMYSSLLLFALLPVITEGIETIRWNYGKRKI